MFGTMLCILVWRNIDLLESISFLQNSSLTLLYAMNGLKFVILFLQNKKKELKNRHNLFYSKF
jgi:uncharacterized protein YybS (DUF2232 family)